MSDFRDILRGTFILDQYHHWKYRGHFSPFHCCFGNIPTASDRSLLFRKEMPVSTFSGMPLEMWLLLHFFFSSTFLTHGALWVRAYVWKYFCRLFYGAAGGSGAHCSCSPGLCFNWLQRLEPCGQVDDGPAQPGASLREAKTGHCQHRVLPHSYWSPICIVPVVLRA